MKDTKLLVATVLILLAFLALIVISATLFNEKPKPVRDPEPFTLSDEEEYKNQPPRVWKLQKTPGRSTDIDIYDIDDTYEIEDAIEELRREHEELKKILEEYGNRENKRLDEEEFWSVKNR